MEVVTLQQLNALKESVKQLMPDLIDREAYGEIDMLLNDLKVAKQCTTQKGLAEYEETKAKIREYLDGKKL